MKTFLVERVDDNFGWFTQIWECRPPELGSKYRVTRQTWNDEYTERTIHEWRAA